MLSANRKFFNETMLPKFVKMVDQGSTVLDVGKSVGWHSLYAEMFKNHNYLTLDKNPNIEPDIVEDFEETSVESESIDAIIIMGSFEQTSNPFELIKSAHRVLKISGLALFGICSIAFPLYENDFVRFTFNGALKLLKNFEILEANFVGSIERPEYLFYICRKNERKML